MQKFHRLNALRERTASGGAVGTRLLDKFPSRVGYRRLYLAHSLQILEAVVPQRAEVCAAGFWKGEESVEYAGTGVEAERVIVEFSLCARREA
ncbi:hypothetical protein VE03_10370, partial [Pseudogymnoascus sp. 23342-1-I1]